MNRTFRQSMSWLHTWAGLVSGWLLYFIFTTGTLSYARFEIDRWMMPELPRAAAVRMQESLPGAMSYLAARAPDAQSWTMRLPTRRTAGSVLVWWEARPGEADGEVVSLDPATGRPSLVRPRDTGGGGHFFEMHLALHYVPFTWGVLIVGACAMFMLVGLATGVVIHKKIFRDFFTFRPGKGQTSWLDAHNAFAVTALPFHVMITWSGLVLFLFTYMPVPLAVIYGERAGDFKAEMQWLAEPALPEAPRAPMAPLSGILDEVERRVGADQVRFVSVQRPGRANAEIRFRGQRPRTVSVAEQSLTFSAVTGALLRGDVAERSAALATHDVLLGLHIGDFAGPLVRTLYVISGLTGTAMIGSGLLLWVAKRKAKLARTGRADIGVVLVERLNMGAILGLPIAVAAYFWANRLLPVDLSERHEWEVHVMFLTWAAMFIYPICRPPPRVWREMFGIAACAFGFIPFLNALTSDRHLAVSIPTGDWVFAGFDVMAFAVGVLFGGLAVMHRRRRSRETIMAPAAREGTSGAGAR